MLIIKVSLDAASSALSSHQPNSFMVALIAMKVHAHTFVIFGLS